jgi:ribosomal protein S12 methylthiotransferase accessory factor
MKWTKEGTSRVMPPNLTLGNIKSLSKIIGLTRLADITLLDVLSIPNYSAVVPGTADYIWVYSGKGPTRKHAMASALMESIERYSALPNTDTRKIIQSSYEELSKKFTVIHPDQICEPTRFQFRNDMQMDYLTGFDLINNREVMVPAPLALFRYEPKPPSVNPFSFYHTNGLASGNVMEEAVCHSLCELIERDALSIAELRASAIPFHFVRHIADSLRSHGYSSPTITIDKFRDEFKIFPDVDFTNVDFKPITNLIKVFERNHISLIVKDITTDIGIPTFNAASVEWVTHDYGYLAEGHGTHPDVRIALLRAITEVSQTRAANIQGARDDLRKIKYNQENTDEKRSWRFMPSDNTIRFSEIKSYYNPDILDDIKLILDRLRKTGLVQVIIVNLTNNRLNVPVVRTIVPGLETFKITKSVVGWRGRKFFKV